MSVDQDSSQKHTGEYHPRKVQSTKPHLLLMCPTLESHDSSNQCNRVSSCSVIKEESITHSRAGSIHSKQGDIRGYLKRTNKGNFLHLSLENLNADQTTFSYSAKPSGNFQANLKHEPEDLDDEEEFYTLLTPKDVELNERRYRRRVLREQIEAEAVKIRREHRKRRRKWLERLGNAEELYTEEVEETVSSTTVSASTAKNARKSFVKNILDPTSFVEPSVKSKINPSRLSSFRNAHILEDSDKPQLESFPEENLNEDKEKSEIESLEILTRPNRRLEAGRKLPISISEEFCPRRLAGRPLREIDPYYFDKRTFIVIGKDRTIFRFSSTNAFHFLSPFNPIRRTALAIFTHPIFSMLVLTAIFVNCIFMASNDSNKYVEYAFTAFYSSEIIIKALARGIFMANFTLLRDGWNWMDVSVITLAYLMFLMPELGNFSALRSLRVLRALKTVTTVPGLKTIVGALLDAIRHLRDILVLTIFVLSIFALIGLQLYRGTLLRKCVLKWPGSDQDKGLSEITQFIMTKGNASLSDIPPNVTEYVVTPKLLVDRFVKDYNLTHLFSYHDSDLLPETFINKTLLTTNISHKIINTFWEGFDNSTRKAVIEIFQDRPSNWLENDTICRIDEPMNCPDDYECVQTRIGNPNNGYTSFDNFGSALLCTFRLMTQDYWENLYRYVIVANGRSHILYFILVIFLGSYYLVNVILAIVSLSYDAVCAQDAADAVEELAEKQQEEERKEAAEEARLEEMATFNSHPQSKIQIEDSQRVFEEVGQSVISNSPKVVTPNQINTFKQQNLFQKPPLTSSLSFASQSPPQSIAKLSFIEHPRKSYVSSDHDAVMMDYKKSVLNRRPAIQVDKRFLFDFMNEMPTNEKAQMRMQGFHAGVQAAKEAGYERKRQREQFEKSLFSPDRRISNTSNWMKQHGIKNNTRRRASNFEIEIHFHERPASSHTNRSNTCFSPRKRAFSLPASPNKCGLRDHRPRSGNSSSELNIGLINVNSQHLRPPRSNHVLRLSHLSHIFELPLLFADESNPRTDPCSNNSSNRSSFVKVYRNVLKSHPPLARMPSQLLQDGSDTQQTNDLERFDEENETTNSVYNEVNDQQINVPESQIVQNDSFKDRLKVLGKSIQATGEAGKLFLQSSSNSILPNRLRGSFNAHNKNTDYQNVNYPRFLFIIDELDENSTIANMVSLSAGAVLPGFALTSPPVQTSSSDSQFRASMLLTKPPEALMRALKAGYDPAASKTLKLKHPACCQQTSTLRKCIDKIEKSFYALFFSWECCPRYKRFQEYVAIFILDPFSELFITVCIVANTALMIVDQPDITESTKHLLNNGNYFFTVTFGLECMFKLIALGLISYFQDKWNRFDFIVVICTLIEIFLSKSNFLILRSLRLLRVLKLAKSWQTMNVLFSIIGRTLGALGNLTLVVIICIFVFAVFGMSLFGDYYQKGEHKARLNFEDFTHSFMVVFRVLCGEWIESMWECLRVTNGHFACILFFLTTMIFGNLVVLNLFLALLLSCFGTESLQRREEEAVEQSKLQIAFERIYRAIVFVKIYLKRFFKHCFISIKQRICILRSRLFKRTLPTANGNRANGTERDMKINDHRTNAVTMARTMALLKLPPEKKGQTSSRNPPNCVNGATLEKDNNIQNGIIVSTMCQKDDIILDQIPISHPTVPVRTSGSQQASIESITSSVLNANLLEDIEATEVNIEYWDQPDDCLPNCLQKLLGPVLRPCMQSFPGKKYKSLRNCCYTIVEHKYFEGFIIIMILLSSGSLMFEDKSLKTNKQLQAALDYLDKYFTFIFTMELLMKWLAYGVRKYFKDAWCWLDFVIVAIALASLVMGLVNPESSDSSMSSFKAMRTLRALRPLRAVSRWELMRIVVNALIQAIPAIFNVFLVILVFWLIFSIMGMQLFGGRFRKCVSLTTFERLDSSFYPNKSVCDNYSKLYNNVTWQNSKINFDNVLNGYLALLQVATFKGWLEIMADAVDIVGPELQPIKNHSKVYYFYFISFIIFGAFFTLNLFIGVIIDNFNVQKRKAGGSIEVFLTDEQKKYYNAMKKMSNTAPQKPIPRPKMKLARLAFDCVTNQKFDLFIMCVILLNTFIMCIEYHGQSEEFHRTLESINRGFVVIFAAEFALKLIGQRLYYFKIYWNIFDFVVVAFSIVCWVVEDLIRNLPIPFSPTVIRIVRLFRIGRVLRLVKSARGIRTLLFALIVSLPALVNIGVLLFMVMFIYAIVGMSFFGNVQHSAGITKEFNFESFGQAVIILFQISTSAGWNDVLAGIINDSEHCTSIEKSEPGKECANYVLGILYIVSYLIISYLVIVNMYIAVILENFSQATEDVKQGLTQDDFDQFYEIWEEYDFKARGFINLSDLSEFVDRIGAPLGIPQPNKIQLARLAIPICQEDRVFCVDLLDALTKNFLGQQIDINNLLTGALNPTTAAVGPAGQNAPSTLTGETDNMAVVAPGSHPDIKPKAKNTKEPIIVISNTYQRQRENYASYKITNFIRRVADYKREQKEKDLEGSIVEGADSLKTEDSMTGSSSGGINRYRLNCSPAKKYAFRRNSPNPAFIPNSEEILAQIQLID